MSSASFVRQPLTRAAIVEAALRIADRDGFEALSMRRVAAELGVGTMSLYHHVADRDELLYHMADAIGAEMLIPGAVPRDWREALRQIALRTRAVFVRHPWLLDETGQRPVPTPNMLRHIEQSAAAVENLDVEPELAMAMVVTVDDYTIGHAVRERQAHEWRKRVAEPLPDTVQELLDSGELPRVARFMAARRELAPPPASHFETGLEWLLDGIAARIERAGRRG